MRIHRNLVVTVIEGLQLIFNEQKYADKVIEQLLKQDRRRGARDRAFIAETTYDIVRWKRLFIALAKVKEPLSERDLFRIIAVWIVLKGIDLPRWEEFTNVDPEKIRGDFSALSKIRKFRESVPDWLDELGVAELGETSWTEEIAALNQQAEVVLRANRLKTTPEVLRQTLLDQGVETDFLPGYGAALQLRKRKNVFQTQAFKDGLFEVQDASSQLVAPFTQVKEGERVVDACAGAGGKSLHLASLMGNKGQLLALDIYPHKLKELKRRARRNGAFNIETRLIDSNKVIKKLRQSADCVLIDAPCTGLGVLRRNPDAKWKLNPDFLERVVQLQSELLERYSAMVKPGGRLIYATCSILPRENSQRVAAFLDSKTGAEFVLEAENQIRAADSGFDGFYMARLRRRN